LKMREVESLIDLRTQGLNLYSSHLSNKARTRSNTVNTNEINISTSHMLTTSLMMLGAVEHSFMRRVQLELSK
jgi:hypothetical protein